MSDDLVARLLDGIVAPEGAFNDDPPIWAQDPFNGDTAEKCGRCDAWRSVVRPGKTQCDYCCDSDDYGLRIKAAQALTEARAEIERLRDTNDRVARVDNSLAKQLRASIENNAALVGELSTLRARVREVVGPFAKAGELFGPRLSDEYDQCIYSPAAGDEYSLCGDHLRAARQLMEEVK